MTTTTVELKHNEVFTSVVAGLGAFLDGFDLTIIGGVLLFLVPAWKLTPGQTGFLASVAFVGMMAGAISFGRVADRVGRRNIFLGDLALFIGGSLICALAPANGFLMLTVGRLVIGLAIGADLPISSTLIAEVSSTGRRGFFTGLLQGWWFGGAALAALVSVVFVLFGGTSAWRLMFGVGAILAVVVLILRIWVSESPLWAAAMAQSKQRIGAGVGSGVGVLGVREHDDACVGAASGPRRSGRGYVSLFAQPYRVPLFLASLFWFLGTIRVAAFVVYTPSVLHAFGVAGKVAPLLLTAGFFGSLTAVSVGSAVYIDRVDRRAVMFWTWALATVLTVVLAFVSPKEPLVIFALLVLSALPIQTMTVALWPWSVEFFPTLLRGSAEGISGACGKFGGLAVVLWYPVIAISLGWRNTMLVFVGIMLTGVVALGVLRPIQTRGRTLEDIELDMAAQRAVSRAE